MTDLLGLVEEAGSRCKKVASTNGGEYAGPCPKCGGNDRFRVWPRRDPPRYWCRRCGISGDDIEFCREFRGCSYHEACEFLGKEYKIKHPTQGNVPKMSARHPVTTSTARAAHGVRKTPDQKWRDKALAMEEYCKSRLLEDPEAMERLQLERGLGQEVAEKYLGVMPQDCWYRPEEWGLAGSKIYLPQGLVMFLRLNGEPTISRVKIRKADDDVGAKYMLVKGGNKTDCAVFGNVDGKIAAIVEAELDAMLIEQEHPEIMCVAMGGASNNLDSKTDAMLRKKERVLLSFDYDDAGIKAMRRFEELLPNCKLNPSPWAKTWADEYVKDKEIIRYFLRQVGSHTL